MRAVRGESRAAVAQGAADAQFGHGVGSDHQFEAVEIGGQCRGLTRNGSRTLFGGDAPEGVFDAGGTAAMTRRSRSSEAAISARAAGSVRTWSARDSRLWPAARAVTALSSVSGSAPSLRPSSACRRSVTQGGRFGAVNARRDSATAGFTTHLKPERSTNDDET